MLTLGQEIDTKLRSRNLRRANKDDKDVKRVNVLTSHGPMIVWVVSTSPEVVDAEFIEEGRTHMRPVAIADHRTEILSELRRQGLRRAEAGEQSWFTSVITDQGKIRVRVTDAVQPRIREGHEYNTPETNEKINAQLAKSSLRQATQDEDGWFVTVQTDNGSKQVWVTDDVPSDYETCGTCGFDHEYEPVEAQAAHRKLGEGVRFFDDKVTSDELTNDWDEAGDSDFDSEWSEDDESAEDDIAYLDDMDCSGAGCDIEVIDDVLPVQLPDSEFSTEEDEWPADVETTEWDDVYESKLPRSLNESLDDDSRQPRSTSRRHRAT